MRKKNYKERNEELHDLFQEFLSEYRRALENIGELRAENEFLKGILQKHGLEIPAKYVDF
jgi:metal-responsive CopG/Arc/MetJ family transcriptional regulator